MAAWPVTKFLSTSYSPIIVRPSRVHYSGRDAKEAAMSVLDIVILILIISWAGGMSLHVGNLIHLLLVIALITLIYRVATGRRL